LTQFNDVYHLRGRTVNVLNIQEHGTIW